MHQTSRHTRLVVSSLLFTTLLVGAITFIASVSSQPAVARPAGPLEEDRPITLAVRILMEQGHLTNRRIDNTISQRWLDAYLKALDPWKLYFYQSDIDEFSKNRDSLDDMFRRQNIDFAYNVFSRFLARVDERVASALAQVDVEHDFKVDEQMIRDRDEARFPRSPEEAAERWRKRVKFDILTQLADEKELDEIKKKLRRRYSSVLKRWQQTSDDELLELYLTSMTSAFDPHSSYLSPTTLENFEIAMQLELDGIGAELRSIDGYTEVSRVVRGGAADREGTLKKGDQIVGVGQGTSGEIDDVIDVKLNDVVKKIRGKRGTIVRLLVNPADNPNTSKVTTITRDRIELQDQQARSVVIETGGELLPDFVKPNGQPYRIGVINLPSFYLDMQGARLRKANFRSTTRDVRRLLEEFNQQQVDMVVVDLRYNGGGAMQEAVNMTGLFIDQGPVVQVKLPVGRTQALTDPEPGMTWSGPLAVLTNKFSASASEIFAGAIKDYGRGVVIGDTATHGKGTVQQVFNISEELSLPPQFAYGALKMTIQQFYRPDGDSTQNRGVMADVTIPALTDHLEGITEGELDFPIAFDTVRVLPHDRFSMINPATVAQLQANSKSRVSSSEEFAQDMKRIRQYEERKDRKTVTLNLEKYLAERAELDADKETEKTFEKLQGDRPVFDTKDHYNLECLAVSLDYLRSLGSNKLAVAR